MARGPQCLLAWRIPAWHSTQTSSAIAPVFLLRKGAGEGKPDSKERSRIQIQEAEKNWTTAFTLTYWNCLFIFLLPL